MLFQNCRFLFLFGTKIVVFGTEFTLLTLKVKISNIFIRFLARIPRERRVLFQISLKVFQKGTKILVFGTASNGGINLLQDIHRSFPVVRSDP